MENFEALLSGKIPKALEVRVSSIEADAHSYRLDMEAAKIGTSALTVVGLVLSANPLIGFIAAIGGLGYAYTCYSDWQKTRQFCPVPGMRKTVSELLGHAGGAEDEQYALDETMKLLSPAVAHEYELLLIAEPQIVGALSQIEPDDRLSAYRYIVRRTWVENTLHLPPIVEVRQAVAAERLLAEEVQHPMKTAAPAIDPVQVAPTPDPVDLWQADDIETQAIEVTPLHLETLSLEDSLNAAEKQQQESWLDGFLFNPDGSIRHANIKIDGSTGEGKTTLAEEIMRRVGKGRSIERYLVNPKHIESKPSWSFRPYVSSITMVMQAIDKFCEMLQARIEDPDFSEESTHRFYVIDEHDWCYEEHGKLYISGVRKLIKVCRELNDHVVLCGQSALAKDTGLSGSDFRQMGRIVLGAEAIAFLKNPQYLYSNKAELIAKAERYQAEGKRFALAIPSKGTPDIYLTPHIEKKKITLPPAEKTTTPTPIAASKPTAQPGECTIDLLLAWIDNLHRLPTDDELRQKYQELTGKALSEQGLVVIRSAIDGGEEAA